MKCSPNLRRPNFDIGNLIDFRFHRKQLPNYTDLDDRDEQYKIFKMTGFIPISSCTKILYV